MNLPDIETTPAIIPSKRRFLKQMLCAPLLAAAPGVVKAAAYGAYSHKSLDFVQPQTGERLAVTYFEHGRYLPGALREIDSLLRDFHTGDIHPMDPSLLDLLYDIKQLLGLRQPIEVVSGYRSPYTNAYLRNQSHGVAKHSLHIEGRAIDIRVDGVPTALLKRVAVAMQRGGVGYYPRTDFVHLDTGEVRAW